MPAPKKNQNAAKSAKDVASSLLQMRCRGADKKRWTTASRKAGSPSLAQWVVTRLNKAAGVRP